ncbi:HD domain-containing protein [Mycoplasmoides alvi]|uniref:HD domain-containing protein n=1 Tax=Mycoplasmoides alvi TaxID=78580 RepID=UPI00069822A2|nr:HD domain-containing protein [Mycoplasmoides alvi]
MKKFNDAKIFSFKPFSKLQFLKDPIHNEINFDEDTAWMYNLLSTQEFKRLQDIKQLGLSVNIFPGATHTRAAHCLGAYEVMRRILSNASFKNISKCEKLTLLCASLLHDIGHAPHSHAFEDYFVTSLDKSGKFLFEHEDLSTKLITNPKGNIYHILKKNKIDPEMVASLISPKHANKQFPLWMSQLISSELDVDRLDYLLRDSYYTGANYGYVDVNALTHWIHFDQKNKQITFMKKAIPVIENFLIGRYHMYQTVYLNEKTSLSVAALWFAFKRIKHLDLKNKFDWQGNNYIKNLIKVFFNELPTSEINLSEYIWISDSTFNNFLLNTYLNNNDAILHKILESYFNKNQYIMLLFDDQNKCNFYYKKFQKQKEHEYFVTKYEPPKKNFYSKNKKLSEILIYDEITKKTNPISKESQIIKNGNELFLQSNKYIYGILIHEDFFKK